ncbi:alcohol dehydrogenase class-3 chain H [Nephila pilipes]|uniref:Alcohol dehydrogenase class-3 chain H n=1 Tax=Nephila pilipes TaxID=299642 RepID=A0A8X6QM52_NEPPI|nr:alcohol dehydrogenase class-3 chain H [Nephila pilipes]
MATVGKPIECKAAVSWKMNGGFSIETVEVAVPKKGEVRVKIRSAGICHSDLHVLKGMDKKWPFPCVLGHEGAGVVESVGEGVASVVPGDVVVLVWEAYCGECDFCKDPRTNLCQKQPRNHLQMDGTSRITCKGQPIFQMMSVSAFSEYTVTSEFNVAKVDPMANQRCLALAGCCIPTGYGAVKNVGKVTPGSTCAVWGLGAVGMCVLLACKDQGASKIIGIDLNPRKFLRAIQFGATDCLDPEEVNVKDRLSEMTNGGVDFCFVSVGVVSAMEQAFLSSHPQWGKTVVIGLANVGETMKVGVWELIFGRQLLGTYYGSYKSRLHIPHLVDKAQIHLENLVSHYIPLERIADGFDMLKTGESLRTVIDFETRA